MVFEEFKNKYEKKGVLEVANSVDSSPLVSICIQTYQHMDFIEECLNSILEQHADFDFEILLGDDESTDGTRELCLKYAAKYPDKIRLLLHHRENNIKINGKPTGRFNLLYNIFSARGEYIALCEGDDYWTNPLKLQRQVDFLQAHQECAFCFHKAHKIIKTQAKFASEFPVSITKNVLNTSEYLKIPTTATSSLLFRNIPLKALTELKHSHGDFLIYCSLLEIGKAGYIDETMSIYRIHEFGISFNYTSSIYLLNRIMELKVEKNYFFKKTIKNEIGRIYKEHIRRFLSLHSGTISWRRKYNLKMELLLNESFQKDLKNKFIQLYST